MTHHHSAPAVSTQEKEQGVKPLFIPLATRWFMEFQDGRKTTEYRAYGAKWNEKTCFVGRPVTLSLGYGKQSRLSRVVSGFRKLPWRDAPVAAQSIYPKAQFIAAIALRAREGKQT